MQNTTTRCCADIKPEDTEYRAKFQLTYDSSPKKKTANPKPILSFLTTKGINRRIQGTNLDNHQRDTLAKIAETAESIESIKHEIQREAPVQQNHQHPSSNTRRTSTAENKQPAAELDALASDLWKRRRAPHIAQLSEQLQKHLLFAASKIAELAMMIEKEAGTHEK